MIEMIICVDNFHAVFIPTDKGLQTPDPRVLDPNPQQPITKYIFDPPPSDILYVAAWADDQKQQGLLAEIKGWSQDSVISGGPEWMVYPTSAFCDVTDRSKKNWKKRALRPPGATDVQAQIDKATANDGLWKVPVLDGPTNHMDGVLFPTVRGIAAPARWTWYNSANDDINRTGQAPQNLSTPFRPVWDHGEYLLFRVRRARSRPRF